MVVQSTILHIVPYSAVLFLGNRIRRCVRYLVLEAGTNDNQLTCFFAEAGITADVI